MTDQDLCSSVMYPQVFDEYEAFVKEYGDVSGLPTANYFDGMEPGESFEMTHNGRDINVKYICRSPTSAEDGMCDVIFEVMGLPRIVRVVDKSQADTGKRNARADAGNAKQLGSPMPGQILVYKVGVGDSVEKGQALLSLTAMKMETVVVAPVAGEIASLTLGAGDNVDGGDLLLTFA